MLYGVIEELLQAYIIYILDEYYVFQFPSNFAVFMFLKLRLR